MAGVLFLQLLQGFVTSRWENKRKKHNHKAQTPASSEAG